MDDWFKIVLSTVEDYCSARESGIGSKELPSFLKMYHTIAESIKRSAGGIGKWRVEDITQGLFRVAIKHNMEKVVDTIDGEPVTSK